MTVRRILASSGGFLPTDRWGVPRPGGIVQEALRCSGADRPKVLLLMTATGDNADYLARTYASLGSASWSGDLQCDVRHLALFPQPNIDVAEAIGTADVIWVGGGSVANLLAVWRLHGVDSALTDAWVRGTVLAGVSAGSICWHLGGTTDSFGPQLREVTDGLGLVPFANGVHYDSEPGRRPLLQSLVADRILGDSYATDDGVGILYEGTEAVAVITDREVDPESGPAAYFVTSDGSGGVVETRLAPGRLR